MQTKRWLSALLAAAMAAVLIPSASFAEQAGTNGSSVVIVQDTPEWYGDETKKYDTLTDFWNEVVTAQPADYMVDAAAKTVTIGSAEALVWWAQQVNQGISFAGYTVSITNDMDLSAYYWTPICTGAVSCSDGKYTIADNGVLNGTVIEGNRHTITGLTTQEGVRGPNADSRPGDGQNCYYEAGFIGYSSCDITMQNLVFDGARIAISEPFTEVTQQNGSSMVAVIVGAQMNGSLTLKNVAVRNASTLAMQKTAAFVANLMGSAKLTVEQCEISNSSFSAYFMAAPIAGYGTAAQIDVNGILLSGNTVQAVQQTSSSYSVDPDTGAQYCEGELNASTTAVCYDGSSAAGNGTVLQFAAEVDGYAYPTLADAVEAVVNSADKTGTVTLLKDSSSGGIGLFKQNGATGVNLTIDFGGHTYTFTDPAVGSPGTESQALHLEMGNTVTLKNGTIAVSEASTGTKTLIQNYSNLTLEDLTLQGAAVTQCIVSSNYGDTVLRNVSMDGTYAGGLVALDVMHWHGTSYEQKAPTMTVCNTEANTIRGSLDVYCYGEGSEGCTAKSSMTIYGGSFTDDPTDYLAPNVSVRFDEASGQYVTHGHELVKTEAKAATCDTDGNIAYWYCAGCGKYFSDEAGTKEISLADTVLPALGHNYENGVCTNCGAEIVVDVPVIDTTKPVESVQAAVDASGKAVIDSEADRIVEAVAANEATTAVDDATAAALRTAVEDGQDITVSVEFDNTVQASDTEKNLVSGVIGANGSIQSFFDLSIVVKADGTPIGKITNLSKPMTFTVAVPASMIAQGRELSVIRIHNGAAERLATTTNADNTLTFQTDKFSTYALAFVDPATTTTPPSSSPVSTPIVSAPQTGDSGTPAVWAVLLLAACVGCAGVIIYSRTKRRG